MTSTKKFFLITLAFALFCGVGNAQNEQGTIKIGDKAYPQEAIFVKIATTEKPETGKFFFPRFEPGNYCVIVPDNELTVVDLYKDDVLASYKAKGYSLPHSSEGLECPRVMVFVSQRKWVDFPRVVTPSDGAERKAFVQKVEQRLQQAARETEAAQIAALPPACRERLNLIRDWEEGRAGAIKHSKKEENAHYGEIRRLGTLCNEQEAMTKK